MNTTPETRDAVAEIEAQLGRALDGSIGDKPDLDLLANTARKILERELAARGVTNAVIDIVVDRDSRTLNVSIGLVPVTPVVLDVTCDGEATMTVSSEHARVRQIEADLANTLVATYLFELANDDTLSKTKTDADAYLNSRHPDIAPERVTIRYDGSGSNNIVVSIADA